MIDTSLGPPDDIAEVESGSEVVGSSYVVNSHSIVMLHYSTPRGEPKEKLP
jgi:hypothetical protein